MKPLRPQEFSLGISLPKGMPLKDEEYCRLIDVQIIKTDGQLTVVNACESFCHSIEVRQMLEVLEKEIDVRTQILKIIEIMAPDTYAKARGIHQAIKSKPNERIDKHLKELTK